MSTTTTPRDWQQIAQRQATEPLGTPEGAEQLAEAKRYGACADEMDRLMAALDKLSAEVKMLQAEAASDDALRHQLSNLLQRIAVAIRGQEPELTRWSRHDLPEHAEKTMTTLARTQQKLKAANAKVDLLWAVQVPLTDGKLTEMHESLTNRIALCSSRTFWTIARAVELAHGIGTEGGAAWA